MIWSLELVSSNIYLNAKVSQLLLKCYLLLFEPNILLHDIVINKSNDLTGQTKWKSDQWDLRLSIFNKKCKATQIWKVTELQYLTCYRVTVLHHLTFYSEKVFNRYLCSKAEGQTNQSRLFCAFGHVYNVNVKPSIFAVIGRLSTTEYQ